MEVPSPSVSTGPSDRSGLSEHLGLSALREHHEAAAPMDEDPVGVPETRAGDLAGREDRSPTTNQESHIKVSFETTAVTSLSTEPRKGPEDLPKAPGAAERRDMDSASDPRGPRSKQRRRDEPRRVEPRRVL